ncbi:MAG: DALR domain-containing protein [Gemmataceae bacterium]
MQRITGTAFAVLAVPSHPDASRKFTQPAFAEAYKEFCQYLDDDFNTGGAVGVLNTLVTNVNREADKAKLEDPATNNPAAKAEFTEGATLIKELGSILGLTFTVPLATLDGGNALVSGLMQLLLDLRNNLRTEAKAAAKDNPLKKSLFDQTDLIRRRLAELGVTLEDRPGGTTWRVGS